MTATLERTPYVSYAYAYPHKTAYGPLDPPVPLAEAWAGEPKDALFLYLHVPFCEMRCGFCNLFTTANPARGLVATYLEALRRQANVVRGAIGPCHVARMAIGGGTPTFLDVAGLEALFSIAEGLFGARGVPASVETSPRTCDASKMQVLASHGVARVSIGVQTLVEGESQSCGRAQKNAWVEEAIRAIRDAGIPVLNIDLMYGLPGQTVSSWRSTVRRALELRPEELYLYPLYVRPLTGLGRAGAPEADIRLDCYRAGRDLLLDQGYDQVSMRMFRRAGPRGGGGTEYCCQDDGMIGLGCGARSYTRSLHYASEYAVGAEGVRSVLGAWSRRPAEAFAVANWGVRLDEDEQRRRWVVKSILRVDGLPLAAYAQRFGSRPDDDLPVLGGLADLGWIEERDGRLVPTPEGLEMSDAIGPRFCSGAMRLRMEAYDLR